MNPTTTATELYATILDQLRWETEGLDIAKRIGDETRIARAEARIAAIETLIGHIRETHGIDR